METIVKLFDMLVENYGHNVAGIMVIVVVIMYGIYLISKNYSSFIKKYLERK
jgi:hypothetical protein